jgi:hypothetical protein
MADTTLHAVPTGSRLELASAYFDATLGFESLALDVERIRETAYSLACSETFEERAQHTFYAIGELCDRLHRNVKELEEKFDGLSAKHREG